jgi:RNA recognition motif-containing protein
MNIYVGNLYPGITEAELRQEFLRFGEVRSVSLMSDQSIGSGQCRVCGFVKMASPVEGLAAVKQLEGTSLKGRLLNVIVARPSNRVNISSNDCGFSRKTKHRYR